MVSDGRASVVEESLTLASMSCKGPSVANIPSMSLSPKYLEELARCQSLLRTYGLTTAMLPPSLRAIVRATKLRRE